MRTACENIQFGNILFLYKIPASFRMKIFALKRSKFALFHFWFKSVIKHVKLTNSLPCEKANKTILFASKRINKYLINKFAYVYSLRTKYQRPILTETCSVPEKAERSRAFFSATGLRRWMSECQCRRYFPRCQRLPLETQWYVTLGHTSKFCSWDNRWLVNLERTFSMYFITKIHIL